MLDVQGLLTRVSGFMLAHNPPIEPMVIATRDGNTVLIETLLVDAGIKLSYDEVCGRAIQGAVMIANPATFARTENDATILELARIIRKQSTELDGKYAIIRDADGKVGAGTIESWNGCIHLSEGQRFSSVSIDRLLASDVTAVMADSREETEKIFHSRESATNKAQKPNCNNNCSNS